MNTLRKTTLALMTSLSFVAFASGSANAAQVSTEQAVSQFVLAQGKQVMATLADQLQHSITSSLEQFSVDSTLSWSDEEAESTAASQNEKESTDKTAEEE
ncbi:hypothetical protein ACFSJY_03680 [Thalassotalea euphylliae]|uniref:hypothetical protein n=1 Tax=Thalassotalea euphylliae TaxID=1655234 RepID=UPI00363860A4